ncbi:unnamed protein product [Allacma fusca]|uniref:Neuroparsin n=1 Tax=Allacma fusca TaxID=39272 RepID=A0A8J2JWR9_9HEXA|nr:unnamed protein product [Allacma fusca]
MNTNTATLFGVILFISFCVSFTFGAAGMPRCPPCPGGECPEPDNCPHGKVTNYCGRKVCAKGPGEICGNGMFQMYGACGEGMFCRCGRCIGCSLNTFECYDKTCI